jgi:leucyl aminopeptidase
MRQALDASEEEKLETRVVNAEVVKPRAEGQDVAYQTALAPHPEQIVEQPPAIQNESEADQPAPKESTSEEVVADNETEVLVAQATEQLLADEIKTDDITLPEVAYEFAAEAPETDWAAVVPDTEQVDEAVLSAGFPIEFMTDEISDHSPERIMQRMDEEITAHFEQLEPEARESALIILEDVAAATREITEAPHELGPEKLAEIEQNLTELCTELFERIGLELDEETIKWFVRNLMIDSTVIDQEPERHSAFMEEGTHEQLQADFHMLSKLLRLIKKAPIRLYLLGRIAVQLRLLANSQAP